MSKRVLGFSSPFHKRYRNNSVSPLQPNHRPHAALNAHERHTDALIIESDQVICRDGYAQGKSGDKNAIKRLSQASGKSLAFTTGLRQLNKATKRSGLTILARNKPNIYAPHHRKLIASIRNP